MEATDLRKQLLEKIQNADDQQLKYIKTLLESYENEQTVAYKVDGQPLNQKEAHKEISDAEAAYEKGNFTTHEQLKEEIRNWKK